MKRIITVGMLGLLAVGGLLGGCHRDAKAPTATESTSADAALVVTDARLVLPAVPGHPGAFYFTAANPGSVAQTLVGIELAGAGKAEMHQTSGGEMKPLDAVALSAGEVVRFEPGARHAMVFDIKPEVKAGGTVASTLRLQGGAGVKVTAKVEAAGGGMGDMGDMPGMDMSHMDHDH